MGLTQTTQFALSVSFFGLMAFVFGIIAENKKPPSGKAIPGVGIVICKYPSDPTVALGGLSIAALLISAVLGFYAVFFPYTGKSVPTKALFQGMTLRVYFFVAAAVTLLAEGMMIWATVTQGLHRVRNVHRNLATNCPTAKTGLFGGAAFLGLNAVLFLLACQMLTLNARADYLDEDDDGKDVQPEVSRVHSHVFSKEHDESVI